MPARWWREQKVTCTVVRRTGKTWRQFGISGSNHWTVSVRPDGEAMPVVADVSRKLYDSTKVGDRLMLLRGGLRAYPAARELREGDVGAN